MKTSMILSWWKAVQDKVKLFSTGSVLYTYKHLRPGSSTVGCSPEHSISGSYGNLGPPDTECNICRYRFLHLRTWDIAQALQGL